jgi:hypothetical protein
MANNFLAEEKKDYIRISSISFVLYQSTPTESVYYLNGRFDEQFSHEKKRLKYAQ